MEQRYIIPNLSKVCDLLGFLAAQPEGVTSAQIEKSLDIPKTTAFRILRTLCAGGIAAKQGSLYFAGSRLIRIGLQALNGIELRELSVPVLRDVTEETQLTSHIAVLSGAKSLILEVCDSPGPVRVASRAGTLVDLHCSSTGKVFLAFQLRHKLDELLSGNPEGRTSHTLTDPQAIRAEIEAVFRRGYACDDEEYHNGVRCVAAPVYDLNGSVTAALGITGTCGDIPVERIDPLGRTVIEAAGNLSRSLGYKEQPMLIKVGVNCKL